MKKKIAMGLLPLLLLLPPLFPAAAAETAVVVDGAGLFSAAEQEKLADKIEKLADKTDMDYRVVTTDDTGGKSARQYADDMYEQLDAGRRGNHSGMLYLIDMDHREIYISTEGDMLRYLTDERIDALLDDATEQVKDGRYAASAHAVLDGTGRYVEKDVPSGQYNYDAETGERDDYRQKGFPFLALGIGVVAGAAVSVGVFFWVKGRYDLTSETYRYPLAEKSRLELTDEEDVLIGQTVTHRPIPQNTSSSSGRGGSSGRTTTHTSSSGRTHGGGGRRF